MLRRGAFLFYRGSLYGIILLCNLIEYLLFMRIVLTALMVVSLHTYLPAQIKESDKEESDKVFTKVELNAHTDPIQLTRYIKMSVELPDSVVAKIPPGTYRAEVEFVIDVHGYMGQLKLTKDPGYGLGERAMQIMRKYQGKWNPASQCGRLVKSYLKQPIVFVIPGRDL